MTYLAVIKKEWFTYGEKAVPVNEVVMIIEERYYIYIYWNGLPSDRWSYDKFLEASIIDTLFSNILDVKKSKLSTLVT